MTTDERRLTLLTRIPSSRLSEGLLTPDYPDERSTVSHSLAVSQWRSYQSHFTSCNPAWRLHNVPPADECPDGVFLEDALIAFDLAHPQTGKGLLLLASPSAPSRAPEIDSVRSFLQSDEATYIREAWDVTQLKSEGAALDGGDVLKVHARGKTDQVSVYVGKSRRTNDIAFDEMKKLLEPRGYRLEQVPVTKALHLKSILTALPDGTVIGHPPLMDDPSGSTFAARHGFLAVPEPEGVAVVHLTPHRQSLAPGTTPAAAAAPSKERLIMSSSAPESIQIIRDHLGEGAEVLTTDISEFEKLEGCVTCLSVRLRR